MRTYAVRPLSSLVKNSNMVLMKNVGRKLAAQTAAAAAGRVRLFSAVVNSEWVRSSGQKLRILDCDQPGAFQRAHIPDATPFAAATTGLKVSFYIPVGGRFFDAQGM